MSFMSCPIGGRNLALRVRFQESSSLHSQSLSAHGSHPKESHKPKLIPTVFVATTSIGPTVDTNRVEVLMAPCTPAPQPLGPKASGAQKQHSAHKRAPPGYNSQPSSASTSSLQPSSRLPKKAASPPKISVNGLGGRFVLEAEKPLSELCSWQIGGPARFASTARDEATMRALVRHAKDHNLPLVVVGKGSNVLFDDRGFAGVVVVNRICFVKEVPHEASREPTLETRNFHPLTPSARAADPSATRSGAGTNRGEEAESFHLFRAGGGMPFDRLGWHTVRRGWGGLEFATGIPGTVGGAVFMNAGANGMCAWDLLHSVEFLTKDGELKEWRKDSGELDTFDYRWSPFQDMPDLAAITAATFRVKRDPDARDNALQLLSRRRQTQPLKDRTAGCVFRNPEVEGAPSAGALIDRAGLKGMAIGGAAVSQLHANFFINERRQGENATAAELQSLILAVKVHIKQETGYDLEEEIRLIPYNGNHLPGGDQEGHW
eukprot:CAMPEP_0114265184 /NCGR_PEP_ID=MMETSP0058-20121206/23733_1 /TAXON_ID=36894 /ORGANISM="Pyramimonas parkeae, CCMP726" /LENGTH=489 /DNA_ID=CAMNT_0001382165 /DNA_START=186 /DNA_END=1652 /DNA_ORIENTATION=-